MENENINEDDRERSAKIKVFILLFILFIVFIILMRLSIHSLRETLNTTNESDYFDYVMLSIICLMFIIPPITSRIRGKSYIEIYKNIIKSQKNYICTTCQSKARDYETPKCVICDEIICKNCSMHKVVCNTCYPLLSIDKQESVKNWDKKINYSVIISITSILIMAIVTYVYNNSTIFSILVIIGTLIMIFVLQLLVKDQKRELSEIKNEAKEVHNDESHNSNS